ncbi:hypothetical protein KKH07_02000 [Patescibacteria group bacterium]|nr:hypothetical protein [Patescibacteria group bacterium]MBU1563764.1 hypothetical protein [Patescibacteria group bacterium]MBU2068515.1 hypothetical protein [Patescibacteria group bacterium]
MDKLLTVLSDSIIKNMEDGKKGSKLPLIHVFMESEGKEPEQGKRPNFKKELEKIKKAIAGGISLTQNIITEMVPTHMGGYSSLFATPVPKDVQNEILDFLDFALKQCD